MSASYRKDRVVSIRMCKAPPHVSKEDFETTMKSLFDSQLAIPIVQQNYTKFELIFQNQSLDVPLKELGFSEPRPSAWLLAECETEDHYAEILRNSEVEKLVQKAEELGYRTEMNVFVADVVTRLETTPKSRTVLAAEFRPPAHLSMGDYIEKIESEGQGFADQLVSLPIAQKTFAKHSLLIHSERMTEHFQRLGFPASEPVLVLLIETETLDDMKKFLTHPETKSFMAKADPVLSLSTDSTIFGADVVTKINK
ncbi:hypothetical protein B0H14DRAFT_2798030 [Mycena olivaceomarginata]|nr:hypothetical protein B0H14DRAFT_3878755 [Mycena olivaceomarginata]KAJ7834706.1 hypothetical protein B0H14DRAFT_2798030 [Mycena olivaceomarginata]